MTLGGAGSDMVAHAGGVGGAGEWSERWVCGLGQQQLRAHTEWRLHLDRLSRPSISQCPHAGVVALGAAMQQLTIVDVEAAEAAATALRSALSSRFPADLAVPSWIDLSGVNLSAFGLPKDFDIMKPLLWTTQTDALWQELKVEPLGNTFRGQILAGPSGIGKSHIALLLALRCYAAGSPVLYVGDAGEYLTIVNRVGSIDDNLRVDKALLRDFAAVNADLVPAAATYNITLTTPFMRLLHNSKAVVVLDEHGHAYNKLMELRLDPSIVFPFLMPNSYLNNFCTRCIFAGSNQAKFEISLNRTYHPYLRFVLPFAKSDVLLFLQSLGVSVPQEALTYYERWANFVPGEMMLLHDSQSAEAYVSSRRGSMAEKLRGMVDALDKDSNKFTHTVGSLARLFREASMAMGIQDCSFLDGGFVFRKPLEGIGFVAYPLCYPATLAMIDLWQVYSPAVLVSLEKASKDGAMFEDLVWDALLARGFSDVGVQLQCNSLGQVPTTEVLTLRLDEYFVSTLEYPNTVDKWPALQLELKVLQARCIQLKVTLLYRCPKNCKGVDFFVLFADGTIFAVQTSISALLDHSTVATIVDIPRLFGFTSLERYVFVTVTPEKGLKRKKATLDALPRVRIVSAEDWLKF